MTANTTPATTEALILTGTPAYAANLQQEIRLFDPETGNYSGLALPVSVIEHLMRTGQQVFMRIF